MSVSVILLAEISIPDRLDLNGIVAENPFDAPVQFTEQAVFRAYEARTDALTRQLVASIGSKRMAWTSPDGEWAATRSGEPMPPHR